MKVGDRVRTVRQFTQLLSRVEEGIDSVILPRHTEGIINGFGPDPCRLEDDTNYFYFEPDDSFLADNGKVSFWMFTKDEIELSPKKECSCSKWDLMLAGCTCGVFAEEMRNK